MDPIFIITQVIVGVTNGLLLGTLIYFMRKAYNDRCKWRAYAALMGIQYNDGDGKLVVNGMRADANMGVDLYIRGGYVRIISANNTTLNVREY